MHNVHISECSNLGVLGRLFTGYSGTDCTLVERALHTVANTILGGRVVSSRTTLGLGLVQMKQYVG